MYIFPIYVEDKIYFGNKFLHSVMVNWIEVGFLILLCIIMRSMDAWLLTALERQTSRQGTDRGGLLFCFPPYQEAFIDVFEGGTSCRCTHV